MRKNKISIALSLLLLISTAGAVEGAVNRITNPGFESGITSWSFSPGANGQFTAVPPGYEGNNSAKLVINSPASTQLYQTGVKLEPNTLYRLSFAAYSTTGHDMTVKLIKHISPYTNYGLSNTFDLGTGWQVFNYEFTSNGFSGNVTDGRFQFWLSPFAAAGDNYYIDSILLEKVEPDSAPPIVIGNTPTGTNVPVNTQITVTFNESMNQSSAQTAFSTSPTTSGSFSWSGNMMTYTPGSNLSEGTTYNVAVGIGAKDLAGNNMQSSYYWNFTTTSPAPDTSPPIVIDNAPTGTNAPVTTQINVTFNESMNLSSAQAAFSTDPPTTGSFAWSGNMMIYNPGSNLDHNSTYNITVGTGAKDLAGNNLQLPYNWQFTTIIDLNTLEARVAALEAYFSVLDDRLTDAITNLQDQIDNIELIPGPQGPAGVNGLACWDLNGNGTGEPAEDVNGDGNFDTLDCKGAQGLKGDTGMPGPRGLTGANGLACWDLNGNGTGEPVEDINGDGNFDTLDCKGAQGLKGDTGENGSVGPAGEQGLKGDTGENGSVGPAGANGLACWDLNGNGTGEPAEDINGDGNFDTLDCKGAQGLKGDTGENGSVGPAGAQGLKGDTGENGSVGPAGANGLACWDLNGNGTGEPAEDINGDGNFDTLDCKGAQGPPGSGAPSGYSILGTTQVSPPGYTYTGDYIVSNADPDSWVIKAPMPTGRSGLAAAAVNNKIYALGGVSNLNEEYDPASNSWTTKAPMPTGRWGLAAATVSNKIYAIGGTPGGILLNITEEYDPVSNSWTTKAPMPTARAYLAAVAVNNKIYAMGGNSGSLRENEEYDPVSNSWTTKALMPTGRDHLAAAVVNNKIYAIGSSWGEHNYNEEYDPASNSWTTKAPMPTGRWGLAAVALNNKIYAIGGGSNVGALYLNEEYDPASNLWTNKAPMSIARWLIAAATANNKIYAIGGEGTGGERYNLNEEFSVYVTSKTYYIHQKN